MNPPRTLLITGASRGIGLAITQSALQLGWRVIGIARNFSNLSDTGNDFIPIEADLSQLNRLPALLKQISKQYPAIDGVICNAGNGRFGKLEQFSANQIQQQIDLNLTSHILVARQFIPLLKKKSPADLIFMGSEAALQGGQKGAVYCATKFALRGLAQSLREECAGSGLRVGIINPAMVKTDFFRELDFRPGDEPDQHLTAQDVAEATLLMLNARAGAAIDEINLSAQKKVIQFGGK